MAAGRAGASWIDQALTVMQQSQRCWSEQLPAHGLHGCTDITVSGCWPPGRNAPRAGELTVDLEGRPMRSCRCLGAAGRGLSSSLRHPTGRRGIG